MKRHLALGAALLFAALPLAASAETNTVVLQPPAESTLVVSGEGLVSKSPDEAKLSVDITTSNDNAAASSSKNNDIYNALQAHLAPLKLGPDAVRTTAYDVQYIPYPPKGLPAEQRQPRYGYITTRTVSITVSPIDQAGKAIDAATAAGVTDVGNVSFDLKDRRAAYIAALSDAMKDAQRQASALATAAGQRLTRIRSITTGQYYATAAPVAMAGRVMADYAAVQTTPTQIDSGGPIDITAHVTVTYLIN
ncbi:MAG TPA: SIMPL domain-containing protein [Candidatus Baltobacteraceae bacterium]